jgi:hypothetical protein
MQCAFAILSSVTCPVVQCFSTLSKNSTIFEKKKLLNIKCVLIFSTSVWNISYPKKNWGEMWWKMFIGFNVIYPLFLSNFNEYWIFSTDFRKTLRYKFSWKFFHWGGNVPFGQKDRHDEANNRFSQYTDELQDKTSNCTYGTTQRRLQSPAEHKQEETEN